MSVWDEEKISKLKQMLDRGMKSAEIAEVFGKTPAAVKVAIRRAGIKLNQRWTEELLNRVRKLSIRMTCKEAAEKLGVSYSTLYSSARGYGIRFRPDRMGSQRKLTKEKVRSIKKKLEAGFLAKDVAREFGVSETTIHMIKHGKMWKDV